MTINDVKIQVILKVPVTFSLEAAPTYVAEIVKLVFDRGASSWLAQGTQIVDGHFIANRAMHTSYDELLDVLDRYPELPFEVIAGQSFNLISEAMMIDGEEMTISKPVVYVQASEAEILPYLPDIVERDEHGHVISSNRPSSAVLSPPIMGGSEWLFSDDG